MGWLLLLAVLGGGAALVGGSYDDSFEIPGASSQAALDTLSVTFPEAADASAMIVVGAPDGKRITDPSVKEAIEDFLADLERLDYVKGTQSPYLEEVDGLISEDFRYAIIRVRVEGTVSTFTDAQREDLADHAQEITTTLPGATVNVGGEVYAVQLPELSLVEGLGVVVAVLVLVVLLGSVTGAMMPIGSAITGVALSATIVMIGSGIISISSTTLMLVVMLGLAVGIDYALFILSRHRDQLAAGMQVEESAARAVATAGSAVVFAGLTVIIALVGLSIAGLPFLGIMGIFTAVGVAIQVALALTLLPAFLGFAGERLRPRTRGDKPPSAWTERGGASGWWVRIVTRWPVWTVIVVLIGMGALALPSANLKMGLPNSGTSLPGKADRVTFDLITSEFGIGFNGPLVVTGSIVEADDPMEIIDGLREEIEATDGVLMVAAATPNANADTLLIQIVPKTGPDDQATDDLVKRLRDRHDAWQQEWGVDTAITGTTAAQIDVTNRLAEALLPFAIFVVGLSMVLLTMAFRSVLVPLKAALGYLLSVAAALGATTLVFNEGWFGQVINLAEPLPVISFFPIILMGILFGLAMDYEVFLTSRMREEYVHGNTSNWIADGFVHSAKVVIGAALIMFSVFAFFVPSGVGAVKPIAFGLAIGVVLDAFVIRMTLGPALMKLLGNASWWLPAWLDRRLPVLDVEGEALAHQTSLAAWPAAEGDRAIHAEGLTISHGDQILVDSLEVSLEPGEILVVSGEHLQRLALVYALSGRLRPSAGEAKILGHVLPEEASLIRRRTPVLVATNPQAEALDPAEGSLVLVDAADELSEGLSDQLAEALRRTAGSSVSWVLGIMPGTDPATLLDRPFRSLDLTSHLSLRGGIR